MEIAIQNNFELHFRPDITQYLTQIRPGEFHDWFVAIKLPSEQ
jgi:hypothetical protein